MLELKNISKTFFPGTVHEKTALDNLSLTLHEGGFCHRNRRQRCGKIHYAQCHCRHLLRGQRLHSY